MEYSIRCARNVPTDGLLRPRRRYLQHWLYTGECWKRVLRLFRGCSQALGVASLRRHSAAVLLPTRLWHASRIYSSNDPQAYAGSRTRRSQGGLCSRTVDGLCPVSGLLMAAFLKMWDMSLFFKLDLRLTKN